MPKQPFHRRPPSASPKWRGEVAESLFESHAMALGFAVATPSTDCLPFDRIIITAVLYRVQVRLAAAARRKGWYLDLRRHKSHYRRGDFEFLAATTPEKVWFIIPFATIAGRDNILLPRLSRRPTKGTMPWQQYLNRWDLFV